jgi:DNA-directed RNA polymerase subunit M
MAFDKQGKSKTGRKLKFCPKCGSTDVFWAQGMPQFWSLWQCRNCGYRGALILEDGNLAKKLQEKWQSKNER